MNTGGPAFPVPDTYHPNGQIQFGSNGMTLLDWYAGNLSAAYIAYNGVSGNQDGIAREAYDIAEAMLAEKARREAVVQQSSTTDHSPDATKMIELQASNRAANQDVERLRTELYKFADSHAKLTIANRELVEALDSLEVWGDELSANVNPPSRNCSCHINPPCNDCVDFTGQREAKQGWEDAKNNARAILAKHKETK